MPTIFRIMDKETGPSQPDNVETAKEDAVGNETEFVAGAVNQPLLRKPSYSTVRTSTSSESPQVEKGWHAKHWYVWPILALIAMAVTATVVLVVMFIGKGNVVVPSLTGLTAGQAGARVEKEGLRLKVFEQYTMDQAQDGRVIKQEPVHGSKMAKGKFVTVTVGRIQQDSNSPTTETWVVCPECQGNMKVPRDDTRSLQVTCGACHGSGTSSDGSPCPTCQGSGLAIQVEHYTKWIMCPTCHGSGKVRSTQ